MWEKLELACIIANDLSICPPTINPIPTPSHQSLSNESRIGHTEEDDLSRMLVRSPRCWEVRLFKYVLRHAHKMSHMIRSSIIDQERYHHRSISLIHEKEREGRGDVHPTVNFPGFHMDVTTNSSRWNTAQQLKYIPN